MYPQLWDGHGYPPRVVIKSVTGTIVHAVAETVSKELVRAGCISINDPKAIGVMRALGGYSTLIGLGIEHAIERSKKNPRATKLVQQLGILLRGKIPEVRTKVQALLANAGLSAKARAGNARHARGSGGSLPHGLYSELTLRAKDIGWKGKPDLLGLDDRGCEIVEFKTGERKDDHVFQVLVYGSLWLQDADLNPKGRSLFKLTVAYPDGTVEVPIPSAEQLSGLALELRTRSANAAQEVSKRPPLARPSAENCSFCEVKQLCAEYWTPDTQRHVQPDTGAARYADLQVLITGRHGPTSWDATIEVSGRIPPGSPILVRSTNSDLDLQVGNRLRLVYVWVGIDADGSERSVATTGMHSEAYLVA